MQTATGRQKGGRIESIGSHGDSPVPSALTPCPAHLWRRWAGRAAQLFVLAMMAIATSPASARTAAATIGGTGPRAVPAITGKARPRITITADPRDTIYGSLEDLRFVLKRDSVGDSLTVKLWLHQDEDWLERRTRTRYVYFYPQDTIAVLKVHRSKFDPAVTKTGCIIAKVVEARGYDFRKARAPVWVISSPDPVMTLFVGRNVFTEAEDAGKLSGAHVVAYMAPDMPRGVSYTASLDSRGKGSQPELTATAGEDYKLPRPWVVIEESSFKLYDDTWVGGGDFDLSILDDDLREGDQAFEVILEADRELSGVVRYKKFIDGKTCDPGCVHRVHITDDEPVPEMDLSVSEEEIREEGETSSAAMVSIVDDVMFENDQVVTLSLDGTASLGSDYTVSPADADEEMEDYQVVLPGKSASTEVTIKAMSDDVDDPDEKIEVSAAHEGNEVGDMQAIRIMNREVVLPKITLAAGRDTIIGSMEDLVLTLTREGPLDERLTVTVRVAQDERWLPWTSCPATFAAGSATASATVRHGTFSTDVVESGHLTLTVESVDGYDTDEAAATAYVVSQEGPAVRVHFDQDTYRFGEEEEATAVLIAEAAPGMPRGTTVSFSMFSRSGTAKADEDFKGVNRQMTIEEGDFSFRNGLWQVRRRLPVTLIDDEVREGDETCDLVLENVAGAPADLALAAVTPVDITDDEDVPEFELSVSEEEIREQGETSSVATVAITNGKTFADDRTVTLSLAGTATTEDDYVVKPADADEEKRGHQLTLTADSGSVAATFTARDDDQIEPGEVIEITALRDGDAIGDESIDIKDGPVGPTVKVTFEGVKPPEDKEDDAGIATGPFTTRFTFSERVGGFTQKDIDWGTRSGSTEDSTSIGLHLWDFTEVRAGLEYTVEMMATQNGRLRVSVEAGKATSVATGAGNQYGGNYLRIRFPKDRMLVAPTEFTVEEGGGDSVLFLVVLTSEPTDTVKITVSGMKDTEVEVDPEKLIVERKFWRVGRGMEITAGDDDNATSETVTLTVKAWGGGYEGRSEKVVVTVWDDDAAYVQGMSEDEALALADDVTPEAAAAALFGEELLSEDQLAALDRLGNRSGDYDLGDLLSWIARCRRGGASCGVASSSAPESIPAAAAAGLARGTSHRRRRGSGGRRAAARNRRVRRRRGASRYGSALLLAAAMTWWGCAGDVVRTPDPQSDPGVLAVHLTVPSEARDIGAMLVVEGPGMDSVRAPGFELLQSDASSSTGRQVIVSGALSTGTILEFLVPDRGEHARYRVRLLQVAGEGYTPRDVADYTVVISQQ